MNYIVDHIHMICPKIDEVKNWYCRNLEAEVEFEGVYESARVFYLNLKGFRLVLIEQLPGEKASAADLSPREGLDHFGIEVQDLDEAINQLRSRKVTILVEPTVVRVGLRIAYIEAPYKTRIELSERRNLLTRDNNHA